MQKWLTCSTLLDLLRGDREDIQYLDHDLHKYLRQFGAEKTLRINLEALEEVLHAPKKVEEHIVAHALILCRLYNLGVKMCTIRNGKDTDGEENANPSKDWFRRMERLTITSECT